MSINSLAEIGMEEVDGKVRKIQSGKKPKKGRREPIGERTLANQLKMYGIGGYVRNYRDWPEEIAGEKHLFAFDFAWVGVRGDLCPCGSEVTWKNGRGWYCDKLNHYCPDLPPILPAPRSLGVYLHGQAHGQRGDGLNDPAPGQRGKDYRAHNVLQHVLGPRGWRIWAFSTQQVGSLVALEAIRAWLGGDEDEILRALLATTTAKTIGAKR